MPPYIRLETAETSCCFRDGSRVTSPALFRAWQAETLREKGDLARPWLCDLEVHAFVEHGRWLVRCVNCHTGALAHPSWRLACCAECGCVMRRVIVPADAVEIARLLLARPCRENQSWLSAETVAELAEQNQEHGVLAE